VTDAVDVEYDVPYAAGIDQATLDLYRPRTADPVPVVIYVHGGGFRVGDKRDAGETRLAPFAALGVAVASVNYRLGATGIYPAPIHDIKAAVRWLRARGRERGLLVDRLGLWGASAGGYLAAMVALSSGDEELEGTLGDHRNERSVVDAVIVWFAPGDMIANSTRSPLEKLVLGPPAGTVLFGRDDIPGDDAAVRAASPVFRAHTDAPPFLISHGDRDRIAMEMEGRALHEALVRAGAESTFAVVGGAGHEGAEFDRPGHLALTAAWLRAHLLRPESRGRRASEGDRAL